MSSCWNISNTTYIWHKTLLVPNANRSIPDAISNSYLDNTKPDLAQDRTYNKFPPAWVFQTNIDKKIPFAYIYTGRHFDLVKDSVCCKFTAAWLFKTLFDRKFLPVYKTTHVFVTREVVLRNANEPDDSRCFYLGRSYLHKCKTQFLYLAQDHTSNTNSYRHTYSKKK